MYNCANTLWRLLGTGFSFVLFGAIGVLFWGLAYPLLRPFLDSGIERKQQARNLMRGLYLWYLNFMRRWGILDYAIEGGERLNQPGSLVIANHPCLLDIVFLMSQIPNATCIVKPEKARNPFLGIPIHSIGYIYAEDGELLLERCRQELKEGAVLVVFPEGTRTTPGQPPKFKRGAAAIAIDSKVAVVPVLLGCSPTTLTKQDRWYQIPAKKFTLSMQVGEVLESEPVIESLPRSLAVRHLTRSWEHHFIERLQAYGKP